MLPEVREGTVPDVFSHPALGLYAASTGMWPRSHSLCQDQQLEFIGGRWQTDSP